MPNVTLVGESVSIARRLLASPERVYQALLDPATIRAFLAPGADAVEQIAVDAQVGGRFQFVVRRDGKPIEHSGQYLELKPKRRLVFTWSVPAESAIQTKVTIDLLGGGDSTQLLLTHDDVPVDQHDETRRGWGMIFDALSTVLVG